ncbi:LacI family DNA-binding transcriptional regulator [Lactococcus fujiensis]|uniref:Ribose operon repressor n=1 Tax=Lactococcus fujiensis JCM 16395 TaxID=1291764 RepID=A0A2A5RQ36_9LACT|nr:LacI family DNA-binding transcriptional regulator [Lactococcus fujiensis]PCS01536.1 ribose operon repressor [Lactococcus fujiensis JCM 16395]
MVTIKKVAEEAGVSKSTVSRYIAGNGYVGQDAQVKIKAAITKLNFIPNLSARSLKTKRSQLVGLLLPDISNPFFPRLAKGVEEFLQEKGYRVMLGNVGENAELEEEYLRVLVQLNAAGVISVHDFSKKFPDFELPQVIVDRVGHNADYGVFSDNEAGGRLAAEVVTDAGAKNVAVISGPTTAININNRFKASCDYLLEHRVNFRTFYSETYQFEEIQKEAKEVLDNFRDLDTIITPSDIHGLAYLRELLDRGIKVPDQVQLIGYDDILIGRFAYPALSTIHQNAYEMGAEAAQLIYKIDRGQVISEKQIELPVSYVERETIRKKK